MVGGDRQESESFPWSVEITEGTEGTAPHGVTENGGEPERLFCGPVSPLYRSSRCRLFVRSVPSWRDVHFYIELQPIICQLNAFGQAPAGRGVPQIMRHVGEIRATRCNSSDR